MSATSSINDVQPDPQFSKARIEMLCDGVFAIAMTLLVLKLKVPDLFDPESAGLATIPGVLAILAIRKYSERRARAALGS
jgi:uncharacterized membrane protein